ncbi:MAG: type II toxin-antitoxin system Phd/YefM family antitoxin [Planctomycetes bacterium]|nr:type II toxin-antitoxin system Phd/YefM family antitoxin [Planctomycetota bacterium]
MKVVGIKQLKARLSEYVRLVKAGETILVTERDEAVAELRPPAVRAVPGETLDDILQSLAERGEITRSLLRKKRWTWKTRGVGLPSGTAEKVLADLRAEHEH